MEAVRLEQRCLPTCTVRSEELRKRFADREPRKPTVRLIADC